LKKYFLRFILILKKGGVILFASLAIIIFVVIYYINYLLHGYHWGFAYIWKLFIGFHLISIKDLILHAQRIVEATENEDLEAARQNTKMLVGRDVDKMDEDACNRAAMESLGEGLTDGILSPLFYLLIAGLPGLLIFKIVSTMDSMVGYKNERYKNFGWFGARFDDVLNYIPARISWMLITIVSFIMPNYSGPKAFSIGLTQHSIIPGPNAGWGEAALAGALRIRIAGPIWKEGILVNEIWIGFENDEYGGSAEEVYKAILLIYCCFGLFSITGIFLSLMS